MKFTYADTEVTIAWKRVVEIIIGVLIIAVAIVVLWNVAGEPVPATVYLRDGAVVRCDTGVWVDNRFACDGVEYPPGVIDHVQREG
jgi:hypothetical protein